MRFQPKPLVAGAAAGASVYALLRWLRSRRERVIDDRPIDDLVDEASRQSFPASDPPSWTLGEEPPR